MRFTNRSDLGRWIYQLDAVGVSSLRTPTFVKPYHLVTFALAARMDDSLEELHIPPEVEAYAARMGLWEAAGLPCPISATKHAPDGRFHPVQRIVGRQDAARQASKLAAIASRQRTHHMDSDEEDMSIVLQELLNNAQCHADSPTPEYIGLAAAQAWPGGNVAQIAIADTGVGIRSSLANNEALHDQLEQGNACEVAVSYGVTGKPRSAHSGYGLALARDAINRNDGRFFLVSFSEEYASGSGGEYAARLDRPWRGTLVVLEWRLDRPLDLESVYAQWPTPEGFDDDDLDFDEDDWLR